MEVSQNDNMLVEGSKTPSLHSIYQILKQKKQFSLAQKVLLASYFTTFTIYSLGRKNEVNVYTNPEPSDIKAIQAEGYTFVRFIADSQKHILYVFNGENVIHEHVAKQLGLPTGLTTDNDTAGQQELARVSQILEGQPTGPGIDYETYTRIARRPG